MFKVLGRYTIYAFLVALGSVSMILIADQLPGGLQFERRIEELGVTTSEFSPVELLQNMLLVICIALFGWIASRDRLRRPMALSFCAMFAVCLVRELDFFLDFYVVDNLWQVLIGISAALVIAYTYRQRRRLSIAIGRLWPSFASDTRSTSTASSRGSAACCRIGTPTVTCPSPPPTCPRPRS